MALVQQTAAVQSDVEAAFAGELQRGQRAYYTPTREIEVRPDVGGGANAQRLSPEAARLALNVIDTSIAAEQSLADAWTEAQKYVLDKHGAKTLDEAVAGLTDAQAQQLVNGKGGLFDQTRAQFWNEVYRDAEAKSFFEDNGFKFDEPRRGHVRAPVHESFQDQFQDYPAKYKDEFRLSLDHLEPKAQADNWKVALDADNLRFVVQAENRFLHLLDTSRAGVWPPDGRR
jgi:hypothetical protein